MLDTKLKLFGLPAAQGRWLLLPLGTSVLLCLGSVYSWSVFVKPLANELDLTATESLLPYTTALFFYAAFVAVAGFFIPQLGSRLIIAIGGLLVGAGYILSSFANDIGTITLTYGAIAGTGVGTAYGAPMAVAARWFPDRKGLAVGLTIGGFGLSPLITAPLANNLVTAYSVRPTLRVLGIAFTIIILAASFFLKLPPADWSPPSHAASRTDAAEPAHYRDRLLKSRSFYGLWLCYAIGTLVGLSAIGISTPVADEIIRMDTTVAASSVALFALFNGFSRPLFGWLTDRFRPHHVAIGSYTLILIACILMLNAREGQVATYLVAFCLFWFCLGGWLAIAPTATLRFFNPDRYAQNYGIVFTAYGAGALLGTLVTGRIRDWFGSYTYAFYPMAFLAIVGMGIALVLMKRDTARSPELSSQDNPT